MCESSLLRCGCSFSFVADCRLPVAHGPGVCHKHMVISVCGSPAHIWLSAMTNLVFLLCNRSTPHFLTSQVAIHSVVENLFRSIWSLPNNKAPVAIKYFFDFLDAQAESKRITDPDVVHIWKTNRYVCVTGTGVHVLFRSVVAKMGGHP